MPEKLEELKALFMVEARKYNVLPLDDRRVERFNPDIAGRPTLVTGKSQLLFGGMSRLSENVTLNVKNKSHSITAQVTVPEGGAEGVIISQGGAYAGWSLYLEGRPADVLLQPLRRPAVHTSRRHAGAGRRASGAHGVRLRRRRPREGRHGDALRRRRRMSAKAGSTRPFRWCSPPTRPATSAATRRHRSAATTPRRRAASPGIVEWVQIDTDEAAEDVDHLITPEQRLRIAMARQ